MIWAILGSMEMMLEISAHLSTIELEEYTIKTYQRLERLTREDGVYTVLNVRFEPASSGFPDGDYCFSDGSTYHFLRIERGTIIVDKVTGDLFEIVYWVLAANVQYMSFLYEQRHRIQGQDNRIQMFSQRLRYYSELGEDFLEKGEDEIREILKIAPYQDLH